MPESKNESLPDAPVPKRRRIYRYGLGLALLVFVAIQFIPYGHNHSNPPITASIAWDSPTTENLVRGACFNCHSHETRWPWYSHVAPISWLVQSDVDEGREMLDFSAGNLHEIDEAAKLVRGGEMPPWYYRPLHREARLSPTEKDALLKGLKATFGHPRGHSSEQDDDD
jgi:mono/diheme cytochrome c family protein